MNKEIIQASPDLRNRAGSEWLDLATLARVRLTSEDPRHPIESALLDDHAREGWRAAAPGPQTIWIDFRPQRPIGEIHLSFATDDRRTQEFVLSCSADGGVTYREIVRQQFNFSPAASREDESYIVNLPEVTDLKLTITPDISGGPQPASLLRLRVR